MCWNSSAATKSWLLSMSGVEKRLEFLNFYRERMKLKSLVRSSTYVELVNKSNPEVLKLIRMKNLKSKFGKEWPFICILPFSKNNSAQVVEVVKHWHAKLCYF